MSYVPISSEGSVTSFGPNAFNTAFLAACKPSSGTLTVNGETQGVTSLADLITAKIPGLKSVTFSSNAFALAAPVIGNTGSVSFSSGGYALHVYGWNLSIAPTSIQDTTTPDPTSPPVWRTYMPDINMWGGSFTAGIDSTTPIVNPPDAGTAAGSLPTITLKVNSSIQYSGSAIIRQTSPTIQVGNQSMATFSFEGTGTLTPSGSGNPLGTTASALNRFVSSLGGSATGTLVMSATSSRTFTVADGFLSAVNISCQRGSPVVAGFTIQGSGAVTIA